jgi:hypothetical protein
MDEKTRTAGYWRENFRRSFKDWDGTDGVLGIAVILITSFGYAQPAS